MFATVQCHPNSPSSNPLPSKMQRVGHQDPKLFTTEVGAVVELRKLLFAMAILSPEDGEIMDKNHGLYYILQ